MADSAASTPPNLIARVTAWVLTLKPVRAFLLYLDSRGPMLADSVSYRTMFSVFAGVFLGFSVASLWLADNPDVFEALVEVVDAAIPGLLGEDGLIDPTAIRLADGPDARRDHRPRRTLRSRDRRHRVAAMALPPARPARAR